MTSVELDHQRRRWADARRVDGLDLQVTDGFATGGLGAYVEALDLRIRFLPADPLATPIRLHGEVQEWLSKSRPPPYGGREPQLGMSTRATSSALVRYDRYREDQGWKRFLALHRNGGLEFGQGISIEAFSGGRFVLLRPLVGLVWHLAAMQVEAVENWSVKGPFEISVALAGVEGARLGGFGEGWRDIGDMFLDVPTCVESNVLLRFETDVVDPEALAIEVGERVENTFGSTHRRFVASRGDFEGQFDPRF